jgi:hypothetical protein
MIRQSIASFAAIAALAIGGLTPLVAHEGHDHQVLGTVTMAAPDHVMLKDKDNKNVTVHLTAETKVMKDKKAIEVEDIKAGVRVVITATTVTEKNVEKMVAKQVELGAAQPAK